MAMPYENPNDQERRIRAALGIVRGPLPKVRTEWLLRYYEHLAANLSFPFDAECVEGIPGCPQVASGITVVALLHPDGHANHEKFGLLCRAHRGTQETEVPLMDVELNESAPNFRLIEDYWYWFWNWRFDPQI
jgi:hypothetical protein